MKKMILIGAGGHAKSCIDVIESTKKFKIIGLIDNNLKKNTKVFNYKVIGKENDLEKLFKKRKVKYAHIAIGAINNLMLRNNIFKKIKHIGFQFPVIISKKAYISKRSKISEGTIVMHMTIINTNVKIGKNCIINSGSIIEHDSIIGNNCHISTSSVINGDVRIGDGTFVGSNATIKQGVDIKVNSFIKMGSLVKKDI